MPNWNDEIARRLAQVDLDPAREAEIARELAQHLDDRYAELRAAGVEPDDARQRTLEELKEDAFMRRELQAIEQRASERPVAGDPRRPPLLTGLRQDVVYALRTLRLNRSFTTVAVLTLALGIGATTAIFSTIDAMLFRPLAYDPTGRLVRVFETETSERQSVDRIARLTPSLTTFVEWQRRNQVFDRMALWRTSQLTLLDSSPLERVTAIAVTPEFFSLFDAAPAIGRGFADEDANEPVAVISHGGWQRRFGGNPAVIGSSIRIHEGSRTVVGVLPPEFPYAPTTDFWIPLKPTGIMLSRHGWGGNLLARLKPDVTVIDAQRNMESVVRALIEGGTLDKDIGVDVTSLREWTVTSSRQMLLVLLGAVGCILLIACVNVAGLLAARGAGRTREVAIRASLGAGRTRLLRQLLTESLVLATLGGGAGIALAWLTLGALVPMLPVTVPSAMRPSIDLRVLGFAILLSGLTGLLFGLYPALRLSRVDFVSAVKEGGDRSAGLGRRTGATLVVVEVALALVLLVGAGLMVRSFQRLMAVDSGFDPQRVLVVETSPIMDGDGQVQRARTFYAQLIERLSALPGVAAVGAIDTLPFSSWSVRSAELEGLDAKSVSISSRSVLPGYFRAMGIPLRMGRDFTPADREGAPCVAVVNQSLAKQWPDGSPLGRRVRYVGEKGGWCEIIGVIGDVRHQSLEREIMSEVYMSGLQTEEVELTLVARAENPAALAAAARAQISGLSEPPLILRVTPFETLVARSVAERRRRATLLTLVGSLGVLLAGVGIFGLTSYAVARRTPEIGVRVALGATPRRVLQTIVGGFVPPIASGVVLGLFGAWAATKFVSQYLFGVTPTDAVTLTTVSMLLVGIALLACYLPARCALRVDPVVALRSE